MLDNMLKSGQFALVTNDCAVRKGETVELVDSFMLESQTNRLHGTWWKCWLNGIKVDVKESNLTPIKAKEEVIKPLVTIGRADGKWSVKLLIGNQGFEMSYRGTLKEVKWYAKQLEEALSKISRP